MLVAPTVPTGVVARMLVLLSTDVGRAGVSPGSEPSTDDPFAGPKNTDAPGWKSVPVIRTSVPPSNVADDGDTFVTVGAGTYTYERPLLVAVAPPVSVTTAVTFCVPVPAGDTATSDVLVSADTVGETVVPNFTEVDEPDGWRFVPVTSTDVPPFSGPRVGTIDVSVGMAT